jgi:hypothetical protein
MPRLASVNPMIYRILVYHPGGVWRLLAELPTGLQAPNISNRRARFYFTERGWQKTGRVVAAEARRRGEVVKVIRRKQPRRSQIYRDDLQVAILPTRAVRE